MKFTDWELLAIEESIKKAIEAEQVEQVSGQAILDKINKEFLNRAKG